VVTSFLAGPNQEENAPSGIDMTNKSSDSKTIHQRESYFGPEKDELACEENVGDLTKINNTFRSPDKIFKVLRNGDTSNPGAENIRTSYCKEKASGSTEKGEHDQAGEFTPKEMLQPLVSGFDLEFRPVQEEDSRLE
jgi:hypothetical protein